MFRPHARLRTAILLMAAALLSACANGANLGDPRPELGDFRLCYNIVTTNDAVKGPLSRDADLEVFADHLRDEIDRRFGRYQGDRLYHIAMHIDAYVLALPGIPVIASPRSALIVSVDVWDDALGRPLNEEHRQFTVLEHVSGESVIGSGLTQTADQQMITLSRNAALRIENWMAEHPEWFQHPTATDRAADPAADASDQASDQVAAPATSPAQTTPATVPGAEIVTENAADTSGCGRR